MGYEVAKTYLLVFADREGMEVRAKSASVDEFLELMRFADLADFDPAHLAPEDVAKAREAFDVFGGYLIDWNLEREGVPIECSAAGLRSLDPALAFEIIFAWMEAVASISDPKDASLPAGSPSLEASMPMAPLSASRAS